MAFLAPVLGKRLAFPFFHRRVGEHMVDPHLSGTDVEAIGANAKRDGREEGVGGAKIRPGKPRPPEARQSLLEEFTNARNIGRKRGRHRLGRHAHADIHRAIVAERRKAAVHFAHRALRPGARVGTRRPDAVVPVGEIERDAERIMDRATLVQQRRDLSGRRKATEIVIIDRLGEGLDAIGECDAEPLHQHPRAQRPARIIAVGGDQFVHGSMSGWR